MNKREIYNWFFQRAGELFRLSETPFDREEVVSLINDSVDPVQQVIVDGEKYIGIIEYEEHDTWYEYTRWDDAIGEVEIGVCAICVDEAKTVEEVSRTIDDDNCEEKIKNHQQNEHEDENVDVETGATLLSETTISNNTAIHVGMDGSNSNVDADFVRGNKAIKGSSFIPATISHVVDDFTSNSVVQDRNFKKFTINSAGCIWSHDANNDSAYKLNQNFSIINNFSTPSGYPQGLDFDSNESLWHCNRFPGSIYQIDKSSGNVNTKFATVSSRSQGLALENESDCIWNCDTPQQEGAVLKYNQNGTVIESFRFNISSNRTARDISEENSDGSLWAIGVGGDVEDSVIKLNKSGSIIEKFRKIDSLKNPQGIFLDSSDSMWWSSSGPKAYKLTTNKNVKF